MAGFDHPWYGEMFAQHGPNDDEPNAAVANAILVGLFALSESIDRVAANLDKIGDAIENADRDYYEDIDVLGDKLSSAVESVKQAIYDSTPN